MSMGLCPTYASRAREPRYEETKHEIERIIKSGVILPVDHPTEWCGLMVVTLKPNAKVRVCVDLTKLNEYV